MIVRYVTSTERLWAASDGYQGRDQLVGRVTIWATGSSTRIARSGTPCHFNWMRVSM